MNLLSLIRRTAWLPLAALLASCGGGSTQIEPFVPGRLIVFGDETSYIQPAGTNNQNGLKYSINAFDTATPPALDCRLFPIWVQSLANAYGFVFDACNIANVTPKAFQRSSPGATAGGTGANDLDAQVAAQIAAGLNSNDLITMLVGQNDILEYDRKIRVEGFAEATAVAELAALGTHVAAQVNTIITHGPRVLVVTVPELSRTPFALDTTASATDPGRAGRLQRLTKAYNEKLRTGILQDGRFVGLVVADDLVASLTDNPSTYGLANVNLGVCVATVALPNCTNDVASLVTGDKTSAGNYLWADATHLAPAGHNQLYSLAFNRATGNPF